MSITTTEAIGLIIKTRRKALGLTQLKLCALCNCATTPSLLSRYESGGVEPKIETLVQVAAGLGVTMADLMAEAEAMVLASTGEAAA